MHTHDPGPSRSTSRRRDRVGPVLLAIGAALAVVLAAAWWGLRDDGTTARNPGTAQSLASQAPASATADEPTGAQTAAPSDSAAPPAAGPSAIPTIPVQDGSPRPAAPVNAPVRVRIPALGVDAPVVPEGVDEAGAMALPEDVKQVGWYRYSAPPGSTEGSTVLAGHVDSVEQGAGALFRLRDLDVDDAVSVLMADGAALQYRVVSREEYGKDTVPLADLFSRGGAPRLTLITCGGEFDPAARSYESNVVVTAVPA